MHTDDILSFISLNIKKYIENENKNITKKSFSLQTLIHIFLQIYIYI